MAGVGSAATLSVSVVIPSIGRGVLAELLGKVLAQAPLEVIVVADAHPERVDEVLIGAGLGADPRVRVIVGPGRGVALARQAGLDVATGDVVLWLDDDVVPGPELIDGHRRAHEAAPGRVVVGYMPVTEQQQARRVAAVIYARDYESTCEGLDADPSRVLLALWAGNVSMQRADGLRVPQWTATFSGYPLEDEEFGFRCRRAGLVGLFDRSLTAAHHYDRSVADFLELAQAQTRSSYLLIERYPDLAVLSDPTAGMPLAAKWIVRAAQLPIFGGGLRAVIVWSAVRLGRGAPTRLRVRTAVMARAVLQVAVQPDVV